MKTGRMVLKISSWGHHIGVLGGTPPKEFLLYNSKGRSLYQLQTWHVNWTGGSIWGVPPKQFLLPNSKTLWDINFKLGRPIGLCERTDGIEGIEGSGILGEGILVEMHKMRLVKTHLE